MNYHPFNIESWPRKQHYDFFKNLDMPFFNITSDIDVTGIIKFTRSGKLNFSNVLLHIIAKELNSITEFKLRYVDDELVLFDRIDVGTTIPVPANNTFLYCMFPYHEDLNTFCSEAEKAKQITLKKNKLVPDAKPDLFYFSAIPWIKYNHISHAKSINKFDVIPRIAVGKYEKQGERYFMPLSIEVNHSICDGFHVGKLFSQIQHNINLLL